jgi:ketopantoate reductase
MLHHIAKDGPLEIDDLFGHINRKGMRLGIPTPHHAPLYAMLKLHCGGMPPLT